MSSTASVGRAQGPSTANRGRKRGNPNANNQRSTGLANGAGGNSAVHPDWNPVTSGSSKWSGVNGSGNLVSGAGDGKDENSSNVCLICAEELRIIAVSPCNHPTCHKCCLRQRALYEKKQCLFCRTEVEDIIFTDKLKENYEHLNKKAKLDLKNEKFGIRFTSKGVMDEAMKLLKFVSPFGDEDKDFGSFKKLNEFLKQEHNKTLCMLCAGHKRAFPSELKVMTVKQLKVHESRGDPRDGFKGHPMCGFCTGKRFYSDDELYKHMKLTHERCHICDQIDPSQPQYFKNYEDLFEHFRSAHYICSVPSCLDAKFVVFGDELDLRAHIIKEHPHLSGENRRGMTLIDNNSKKFRSQITTFSNPTRVIDAQNDETNSANSRDVKRKRMEQRARHYVGNSEPDFQSFLIINDMFNKNEISAQELQTKYEDLFVEQKDDIQFLIYDLSELYHSTSEKHKRLRAIYDAIMKKKENAAKFRPLVSDTSSAVNVVRGKWGQKGSSAVGGSNVRFTSLPAVAEPIFSSKASYTNLRKNGSSPSALVIKTGLSSNSSSSTSLNYTKKSQSPPTSSTVVVNSQPHVTAIRSPNPTSFPKLQAAKKKFVAPPVKQTTIPSPSSWGKSENGNSTSNGSMNMDSLDNALPGGKKKSKQKQLLFHIGI
ncbi:unnamed protein product [Kluyveromyces dobzhanskii CBS 2104]|uniref:RING-type E3 ubiquitin transferase n=1 Tax=Kluyveromyces dobzhanskii CBS 2104 TaxID=1427455 RepID=A0A0A8L711_9SACH|nr:unnamed protein product [Kluyveromyces dobzhanskii CBS 2104]